MVDKIQQVFGAALINRNFVRYDLKNFSIASMYPFFCICFVRMKLKEMKSKRQSPYRKILI
jgi:hypothetical protein